MNADTTEREWIVRIRPPTPDKNWPIWLSVHQCSVCYALVVEDFMADHLRWHEQIDAANFPDPRSAFIGG